MYLYNHKNPNNYIIPNVISIYGEYRASKIEINIEKKLKK